MRLTVDAVAPNPDRRAHWAYVKGGPVEMPVLLDNHLSTSGEGPTPQEEYKARLNLLEEMAWAWNRCFGESKEACGAFEEAWLREPEGGK